MNSNRTEYVHGQIINGLTFVEEAEPYVSHKLAKVRKAKFRCFCGNEFETVIYKVQSGHTTSCGCYQKQSTSRKFKKHGLLKHQLYGVLANMKTRCYNKINRRYRDYGGRGISVCNEWLNDFMSFYNWAIENGWKKGLQIDRIDNDGNYESSNCRFVTSFENNHNRRSTILSWNIVEKIRHHKLLNPETTQKEIGKIFRFHHSTISKILANKLWATK